MINLIVVPETLNSRRKLIMFVLFRLLPIHLPAISMSVVVHKEKEENGMIHIHHSSHDSYRARELGIFENGLLDSDVFLQVSFMFFFSVCFSSSNIS